MPISIQEMLDNGEVIYADTTGVVTESKTKKWCHGNRHSLRVRADFLAFNLYAYGPRGGEVDQNSFASLDPKEIKVCPECDFIFEGSFRIGSMREGYLRTTNAMWKIIDIIGLSVERPPPEDMY